MSGSIFFWPFFYLSRPQQAGSATPAARRSDSCRLAVKLRFDFRRRPFPMSLALPANPRRVSVAPMMDWTDRHCRSLHRVLSRHTWLYTEMVTTGALLHGDVPRHLAFTPHEAPVALQLGGSEPDDLARSAKLGEQWGYDEINLNCGCPSERVQRGAFGACLMNEPQLVADCVKAMRDAVSVPVTVKHRIGVDAVEEYGFVRDFVGTIAEAGCEVFIVHARNAILKGLSPKENREIPPLKYDFAYQLKRDFPQLEIIINGGIKTLDEVELHLQHVDGVMLGREAYHNPYVLADVDARFYGSTAVPVTREEAEAKLIEYCAAELARGTFLGAITRHALGLYRGVAGARGWRRVLSDSKKLAARDLAIFDEARQHLREPAEIFE
jgi:tRNA-dihydrouridine synthase A